MVIPILMPSKLTGPKAPSVGAAVVSAALGVGVVLVGAGCGVGDFSAVDDPVAAHPDRNKPEARAAAARAVFMLTPGEGNRTPSTVVRTHTSYLCDMRRLTTGNLG